MSIKMPPGQINIVNRDTYQPFMPSPETHYPIRRRVKSVAFRRFSIDERYEKLRKKGLTIMIDNPEIYENGRRPVNGIFSPLFGADATQDAPVYTCDCHAMTGGENLGRICEKCGSVVRTIEADLRRPGFIDIAPYHILSFHGYNAFSKVLKNLNEIITTSKSITKSGKIKEDGLPTIMDLYDDYEELYQDKIRLPKNIVFQSKILVHSSRLRPLISSSPNDTKLTLLEVNQKLMAITRLSNILVGAQIIPDFNRELEVQKTLNELQQNFNAVCRIIIDQCNTKAGIFRRTLASGRVDNSSRLVIVLGRHLHAHEVELPYQDMMIHYEEEIANFMMKQENIPLSAAISAIRENVCTHNPYFINIINILIRSKKGLWVLINRNPTISKYGILYMRIKGIHKDPTDMTLHLPADILPLIAADFDGDFRSIPTGMWVMRATNCWNELKLSCLYGCESRNKLRDEYMVKSYVLVIMFNQQLTQYNWEKFNDYCSRDQNGS